MRTVADAVWGPRSYLLSCPWLFEHYDVFVFQGFRAKRNTPAIRALMLQWRRYTGFGIPCPLSTVFSSSWLFIALTALKYDRSLWEPAHPDSADAAEQWSRRFPPEFGAQLIGALHRGFPVGLREAFWRGTPREQWNACWRVVRKRFEVPEGHAHPHA